MGIGAILAVDEHAGDVEAVDQFPDAIALRRRQRPDPLERPAFDELGDQYIVGTEPADTRPPPASRLRAPAVHCRAVRSTWSGTSRDTPRESGPDPGPRPSGRASSPPPFIPPRTVTICWAARSEERRASADRACSVRPVIANRVPTPRAACPAASRPSRVPRDTRRRYPPFRHVVSFVDGELSPLRSPRCRVRRPRRPARCPSFARSSRWHRRARTPRLPPLPRERRPRSRY